MKKKHSQQASDGASSQSGRQASKHANPQQQGPGPHPLSHYLKCIINHENVPLSLASFTHSFYTAIVIAGALSFTIPISSTQTERNQRRTDTETKLIN